MKNRIIEMETMLEGINIPFKSGVSISYSLLGLPGFPGGPDSKESACSEGGPASIPGSGRSLGEGNGNPLQYSCLENPMNEGVWILQSMGLQRVGHN